MLISTLLIFATAAAGAFAWLALTGLVLSSWTPYGGMTALVSALIGTFWAASSLPCAACAWPNGAMATSQRLNPKTKLAVYGLILALGCAASLISV